MAERGKGGEEQQDRSKEKATLKMKGERASVTRYHWQAR